MNELPQLSALEARVLAVLVEKEITVPDSYPLSLNALVNGCNQKSSRDPVMSVSEAQVKEALDELRRRSLVMESSGGRVWRYAHNVQKGLGLGSAQCALLTALWLRGPQTSGELRINAERFYNFADLSSVEGYLEDMASKAPARVVKLPRQLGAREARWAHLYCGAPNVDLAASSSSESIPEGQAVAAQELARLAQRISALEATVQVLQSEVARLSSAAREAP